MRVVVNGVDRDVGASATVLEVVRGTGTEAELGVAVAVNGEVVPKSAWRGTTLKEGDRIEVLRAIGGG